MNTHSEAIDRIKKAGVIEALCKALSSRLFEARNHLENAQRDNYKLFQTEMLNARRVMDEAAAIREELQIAEKALKPLRTK